MPFKVQIPRVFDRANVASLEPGLTGVYGLFRGDVCVYIGRGKIRERLLGHLDGDNHCVLLAGPTRWMGEVTGGDASERQKTLIAELNPLCNRRVE